MRNLVLSNSVRNKLR